MKLDLYLLMFREVSPLNYWVNSMLFRRKELCMQIESLYIDKLGNVQGQERQI